MAARRIGESEKPGPLGASTNQKPKETLAAFRSLMGDREGQKQYEALKEANLTKEQLASVLASLQAKAAKSSETEGSGSQQPKAQPKEKEKEKEQWQTQKKQKERDSFQDLRARVGDFAPAGGLPAEPLPAGEVRDDAVGIVSCEPEMATCLLETVTSRGALALLVQKKLEDAEAGGQGGQEIPSLPMHAGPKGTPKLVFRKVYLYQLGSVPLLYVGQRVGYRWPLAKTGGWRWPWRYTRTRWTRRYGTS